MDSQETIIERKWKRKLIRKMKSFMKVEEFSGLGTPEKIRKRNSKICGSRIPNVNRFVFQRILS